MTVKFYKMNDDSRLVLRDKLEMDGEPNSLNLIEGHNGHPNHECDFVHLLERCVKVPVSMITLQTTVYLSKQCSTLQTIWMLLFHSELHDM